MMEQMRNNMNNRNQINDNNNMIIPRNKNYPENITLTFVQLNPKEIKINVQCRSNERLEEAFKKFSYKLCKEDFCYSYFYNGKELNKDLTIDESGLYNNAKIYVVDKNDENQIKKMRQILPLKPKSDHQLNINELKKNITFIEPNGSKLIITIGISNKVSEAIKLFLKRVGLSENIKSLFFLFNGLMININDQRTIEEAFPEMDITLLVVDTGNIIGA